MVKGDASAPASPPPADSVRGIAGFPHGGDVEPAAPGEAVARIELASDRLMREMTILILRQLSKSLYRPLSCALLARAHDRMPAAAAALTLIRPTPGPSPSAVRPNLLGYAGRFFYVPPCVTLWRSLEIYGRRRRERSCRPVWPRSAPCYRRVRLERNTPEGCAGSCCVACRAV